MKNKTIYKLLNILIASVWILNGLVCKILNIVPRHEQIVSKITSNEYSHQLTILIGALEIIMSIWVLSNIKTKLNAIFQILIVACMNLLEFILAPDLLLWDKFNSLFAIIFILIVYFNNFYLNKKTKNKPYVIIS